jgi:hypothetical protein
MDQNSTGGTDKRNWRERLGIGTKESVVAAGKDMPKVSGEFKTVAEPQAAPAKAAPAAAVRPAPMAPRPAAKSAPAPGSARPAAQPAAPRPPVVSPDALANKLKSQRDAAEKLAEQRVAAAKQRAEASISPAPNGVEKPKFTFADDEPKSVARPAAAARSAAQVQRTAPPTGQPQPNYSNQIAPPRPQLGGAQAVPPRAVPPPPAYPPQVYPQGSAYPQGQPYYPQQPQQYPPGYQPAPQGYAPVPPSGYRPIDPATGYTPPPPFNPQMRPPYQPAGVPPQPRLQVPQQRPPMTGFNTPQSGFGAEARPNPRLTNPPLARQAPSVQFAEGEEDDIFEQPAPRAQRRATADEYSQAYREVETGYEDEAPRSYTPLILLSLLALAVVAGLLGWWGYNNYIKNGGRVAGTQTNVPVVAAPEKPAKAAPDATATDNAAAGKAVNSSKKLIYDRIVGDREILGGQMAPSEEQPVQPVNNSAPAQPAAGGDAAPANPIPAPATGTGNDGTPLPLPPPPGGASGTQGSLQPSGKGEAAKTDQATITPSGALSSTADALPVVPGTPTTPLTETSSVTTGGSQVAGAVANVAPPPSAVGTAVLAGSDVLAPKAETSKPAAETITDTTASPAPAAKDKKVMPKKIASAEAATKSLGAKPVVLVPPSKLAVRNKSSGTQNETLAGGNNATTTSSASGGGLYGNSGVDQPSAGNVAATPVEAPKKRRTLLDLFKTDGQPAAPAVDAPAIVTPPKPVIPPQQVAAATPRVTAPAPVGGTGAYVAQLASFKSKSEANSEYSRLVAKHGEIIKRYAPIIEQANVAGSTRYRLNIGPMATSSVASSLCSSLFAAGERDCLVHRQ